VSQGPDVGDPLIPAEWNVSLRSAPTRGGDLSVQLGGGGAIPFSGADEITQPRFRFNLGIRWAPLARDTDGDGVLDAADRCPTIAARGSADGCPVVEGPLSP
jgi:OmpA-OmpF porin, OOP family